MRPTSAQAGPQQEPGGSRRAARIRRLSAAATATTGCVVLIGWYAGLPVLTTIVPGVVAMKPNTALCVLLLSAAIFAVDLERVATTLGCVVGAIAALTLVEYIFGTSLGVDGLLPGIDVGEQVRRMAPVTAVALLLLAAGVLAARFDRTRLMNNSALGSLCLGYVAMLGYAYNVSSLYRFGGYTAMALHTSVCIVVLSAALLLAKPSAGIVGLLRDGKSAGAMLRWALLFAILGPFVLGWIRLWAERQGWIDTYFGVALLVLSMSILSVGLSWRLALVLREVDRQRDSSAAALVEANRTLSTTVLHRTDELERVVETLEALVRSAPVGILVFDQHGSLLTANEQWLTLSELTHEQSRQAGWLTVAHGDDQDRVRSGWGAGLDAGLPYETDLRLVTPAGRVKWVQLTRAPVSNAGVVTGYVASVTNVTAVHVMREEALTSKESAERANAFYDALLAAFPDFVFVTDVATGAVTWSRDEDLLGMTPDEMQAMGPDVIDLVHPEDRSRIRAANLAAADLAQGEVHSLVYRAKPPHGTWHWLSRRVTPFRRDAGGAVIEVLGLSRDLSGIALQDENLIREARYDPLTGLPNRAHVVDRLEVALSRAGQENRRIAVLLCRLDGLDGVTQGAGGASICADLLRDTARRLHNALLARPEDIVGRVGVDTFAIVVEPWNGPGAGPDHLESTPRIDHDRSVATGIAEHVATALREAVAANGVAQLVTSSIGIAYAKGAPDGDSGPVVASNVLRDAEDAQSSELAAARIDRTAQEDAVRFP